MNTISAGLGSDQTTRVVRRVLRLAVAISMIARALPPASFAVTGWRSSVRSRPRLARSQAYGRHASCQADELRGGA
jgi:hypothetical protein